MRQHQWVTVAPVAVRVIRNEDGKFSGQLPTTLHIHNSPNHLDMSTIFCVYCKEDLIDVFGKECEIGPPPDTIPTDPFKN